MVSLMGGVGATYEVIISPTRYISAQTRNQDAYCCLWSVACQAEEKHMQFVSDVVSQFSSFS